MGDLSEAILQSALNGGDSAHPCHVFSSLRHGLKSDGIIHVRPPCLQKTPETFLSWWVASDESVESPHATNKHVPPGAVSRFRAHRQRLSNRSVGLAVRVMPRQTQPCRTRERMGDRTQTLGACLGMTRLASPRTSSLHRITTFPRPQ